MKTAFYRTSRTLLTMLVFLLMLTALSFASAAELKVGPAETYQTIQAAIDAASEGDTITVAPGEYDRFTVASGKKNLTIQGQSKQGVVVKTLVDSTRDDWDNGGINVWGADITIRNMTITAGSGKKAWSDAAISTYHGAVGGSGISLTLENCDIVNNGNAQYGVFWACDRVEMRGCSLTGFPNAFEFMNDGFHIPSGKTYEITGNTFRDCSFAIHGYFGLSNGGGTLKIADNKVYGSNALRSKVIVQDNTGNALRVIISGNTLDNAIVGVVNLNDAGDVNNVLAQNTFTNSGHFVEAIEPGNINFYTTYHAPASQAGYWVLTGLDDVSSSNPEGAEEYIKAAIDAANAAGSHKLSITGIDPANLVRTFTWFKDAIYWQETEPEPSVEPQPVATPPSTGDKTPLLPLTAALAASALVLLVFFKKRRAS